MAQKKERKPRTIPEFKSREEEAEFWDSHDLADYWGEFKPVELRLDKVSHTILMDIDHETLSKLVHYGQKKDINPITLAKMWIIERLKQEDELSRIEHQEPNTK